MDILTSKTKYYLGIKDSGFLLEPDLITRLEEAIASLNTVIDATNRGSNSAVAQVYDSLEGDNEDIVIDPKPFIKDAGNWINTIEKVLNDISRMPIDQDYCTKRLLWASGFVQDLPYKPVNAAALINALSKIGNPIDDVIVEFKTNIKILQGTKYEIGDLVLYKTNRFVWKIVSMTVLHNDEIGYFITTTAYGSNNGSVTLTAENDIHLAPQGAEVGDEVQ